MRRLVRLSHLHRSPSFPFPLLRFLSMRSSYDFPLPRVRGRVREGARSAARTRGEGPLPNPPPQAGEGKKIRCIRAFLSRKRMGRESARTPQLTHLIRSRAHVEMGGLAEARHAALQPVAGPLYHAVEGHRRIAEQAGRAARVGNPSGGVFLAGKTRRLAEAAPEGEGERANADDLRAADVERRARYRAMAQRPQRLACGIALPDHVDVPHGDVDGFAAKTLCRRRRGARRSACRSHS